MFVASTARGYAEDLPRDYSFESFAPDKPTEDFIIGKLADGAAQGVAAAVEATKKDPEYLKLLATDPVAANKKLLALRDAHSEGHGCVNGTFTVDAALGTDPKLASYKVGIYSEPGRSYPAYIRYSNGAGQIFPDTKLDGRGMAVKLQLDSSTPVYLEDPVYNRATGVLGTRKSQDLLMINAPRFFIKNVPDYAQFFNPLTKPTFFDTRPLEKEVGQEIATSQAGKLNLLEHEFYSMVPYAFGKGRAAKFKVEPCPGQDFTVVDKTSDRLLRNNLAAHLETKGACFNFKVLLRPEDAADGTYDVEDSRVLWKGDYQQVAQIKIAPQAFLSDDQIRTCENSSFQPWHAVQDQQPKGGVNRTREIVMRKVFEKRFQLNKDNNLL